LIAHPVQREVSAVLLFSTIATLGAESPQLVVSTNALASNRRVESAESGKKIPLRTIARALEHSWNKTLSLWGDFQQHPGVKAIESSVSYGAGDGNRTHVRSLGSFYTAIVRRPHVAQALRLYIMRPLFVQTRTTHSPSSSSCQLKRPGNAASCRTNKGHKAVFAPVATKMSRAGAHRLPCPAYVIQPLQKFRCKLNCMKRGLPIVC
jgi:hypothetical protein